MLQKTFYFYHLVYLNTLFYSKYFSTLKKKTIIINALYILSPLFIILLLFFVLSMLFLCSSIWSMDVYLYGLVTSTIFFPRKDIYHTIFLSFTTHIYIYYIEIYILCLNIYRLYPRNLCFFLLHQPIYFIYMMIANFSFQAWIYI